MFDTILTCHVFMYYADMCWKWCRFIDT